MLVALLFVSLAAGQAAQPGSLVELRTWLRQRFLDAAEQVDEFKQKTRERFNLEPSRPRLGVELSTLELPADTTGHPVRHTMVTGVFPGSPAEKAGIRPGDRIAAIGDELLDHETGGAVSLYLSNYPAAVELTVERQGTSRKVSVVRQPLACVREVSRLFPEAKWLDIWDQSQKLLRDEAKVLENPKLTLNDLEESRQGYAAMMTLWAASFQNISLALNFADHKACAVLR